MKIYFLLLFLIYAVAWAPAASAPHLKQITREVIEIEDHSQFGSYMKAYYDELQASPAFPFPCADLKNLGAKFPFVFIGDEHTNPFAIEMVRDFAETMAAAGVRPVIVIEFIFHQFQPDVDLYLTGAIDQSELRRRVHFDDYPWAWSWNDLDIILRSAKRLNLRLLAAEEGSNDLETRDGFAARTILADLNGHPDSVYLVMYGTAHLMGEGRIPDLIRSAGHPRQLRIVDFLGRKALDVIRATGQEGVRCVKFGGDVYYSSRLSPADHLINYWKYLKSVGKD